MSRARALEGRTLIQSIQQSLPRILSQQHWSERIRYGRRCQKAEFLLLKAEGRIHRGPGEASDKTGHPDRSSHQQ